MEPLGAMVGMDAVVRFGTNPPPRVDGLGTRLAGRDVLGSRGADKKAREDLPRNGYMCGQLRGKRVFSARNSSGEQK